MSMPFEEEQERALLRDYVIANGEGRRTVYRDSSGHRLIGYGCSLDRPDSKARIQALGMDVEALSQGSAALDRAQMEALLMAELDQAINVTLRLVPTLAALPLSRQIALVDMAYSLGEASFSAMKEMLAAVRDNRFSLAAKALSDSGWYRQAGEHALRNAEVLRTGQLPEGFEEGESKKIDEQAKAPDSKA